MSQTPLRVPYMLSEEARRADERKTFGESWEDRS